jgi:hypothetical protein
MALRRGRSEEVIFRVRLKDGVRLNVSGTSEYEASINLLGREEGGIRVVHGARNDLGLMRSTRPGSQTSLEVHVSMCVT